MNIQEFVSTDRSGRRRTARGKGKQPRLSLGPPAPSKTSERGCLSHEELVEWTRDYSLPDRELRACERAVKDCYKPHPLLGLSRLRKDATSRGIQVTPLSDGVTPNRNPSTSPNSSVIPLNLSKWVRWQTAQTHYKQVGPSEKSKQLVSLLELLDLMHSQEGLGESYATEMKTFLNYDDVMEDSGSGGVMREVGDRVRVCKWRRIVSDSSDDGDFGDEVRPGTGPNEVERTADQNVISDEEGAEEMAGDQAPSPPASEPLQQNSSPCANDRGSLVHSQHAIPRPPSSESLDWLDSIEPSQVPTPLPSSSKPHTSHSPHSQRSHAFQFALPRTPPSSRKGKTLFVTPLIAHSPPILKHSTVAHHSQRSPLNSDNVDSIPAEQQLPSNVDSVDLFNDISSAVLFEEFSDSSHLPDPHREREGVCEAGETPADRSRPVVSWDPSVVCIPDSGDEGERGGGGEGDEGEWGEGGEGGEGEWGEGGEGDETRRSPGCAAGTDQQEISSISEESVIGGVCGHRHNKFARPDFLLTQAPPSSPRSPRHITSHRHITSPRSPCHITSPNSPHSDVYLVSSDSSGPMKRTRQPNKRRKQQTVDNSSDEDDFVSPVKRVRREKRSEMNQRSGRAPESVGAGVSEDQLLLEEEEDGFLDKEAELSGEETVGDSEEEGEDGYDVNDSFINDNSVLTQVPSQSPTPNERVYPFSPSAGDTLPSA